MFDRRPPETLSGDFYKLNPAQVEAELRESEVAESVQVTEEAVCVFLMREPKVEWEELGALETDGLGLGLGAWCLICPGSDDVQTEFTFVNPKDL